MYHHTLSVFDNIESVQSVSKPHHPCILSFALSRLRHISPLSSIEDTFYRGEKKEIGDKSLRRIFSTTVCHVQPTDYLSNVSFRVLHSCVDLVTSAIPRPQSSSSLICVSVYANLTLRQSHYSFIFFLVPHVVRSTAYQPFLLVSSSCAVSFHCSYHYTYILYVSVSRRFCFTHIIASRSLSYFLLLNPHSLIHSSERSPPITTSMFLCALSHILHRHVATPAPSFRSVTFIVVLTSPA